MTAHPGKTSRAQTNGDQRQASKVNRANVADQSVSTPESEVDSLFTLFESLILSIVLSHACPSGANKTPPSAYQPSASRFTPQRTER